MDAEHSSPPSTATSAPAVDEPPSPAPGGATSATTLVADGAPPAAPEEASSAGALAVFILAVAGALTFSFLCSIFESVLLSVSRGHVQALANSGSKAGAILERWKRTDIEVPIAAILILNTIAHTVGATVAGSSYEKVFDPGTIGIFSAVFTLAVLLLTEIIPKTLGVAFANRLAAPVTQAVRVLVFLLSPILKITTWISRRLTGEHKKPVTSVEEIRLLAAIGSREGDVGPRFAAFIDGIASLRELTVHDVMVPRVSIEYLDGTKTLGENLTTVLESGHSRFPFTPTGDLDDVKGVILAKELLLTERHLADEDEVDYDPILQPLVVVPESKSLDEVLRTFQHERKHLAVVVDEYGGTQGVVTLEDVLEEIVGEIEDETDRVEALIVKGKDGTLLCRGHAETRKLFKVLGIEEKPEFVTVGGLVADLMGHVPRAGEVATWGGHEFTVTKASNRRADQVKVRRLTEDELAQAAQEPAEA